MILSLPSLSIPATINALDPITAFSVLNQTTNVNGLRDLMILLSNKSGIVDASSATITCVQNQTTVVKANRATAQTVQLPAWSGQRFPIFIEKSANNYAQVTIQRAGSDTINNPFASSSSPIATTFVLYLPGQSVWAVPDPATNYWSIVPVNTPLNTQTGCSLTMISNQTINGNTVLNLDFRQYDRGNFFNVSTFRFVPPYPCRVNAKITSTVSAGTNAVCTPLIYRNASLIRESGYMAESANIASGFAFAENISLNGTTDFVEFRQANAASRTVLATTQYTNAVIEVTEIG